VKAGADRYRNMNPSWGPERGNGMNLIFEGVSLWESISTHHWRPKCQRVVKYCRVQSKCSL